jgi:hypothetical protein
MDFDTWIDNAWNRHADAPAAVLAELATTGAARAADDAAVGRLMQLAQHVAGAHQGGPAELAAGRALQASLAALPAAGDSARTAARLHDRALALTGGDAAALSDLAAAEAAARRHAQACLALIAAHGDEPLERFFGEEALGLAEAAAGDAAAHGRALAAARDAFARLSPDDQSWCRASLDALAAALP